MFDTDNPACADAPGCGPWEKPSIPNPKYKGVWKPPMIDNPDYKGQWAPRRIPNPNYFEDNNPYKMTPIVRTAISLTANCILQVERQIIVT